MLFDLGFLNFRLWDALDILIVGLLFYYLYKLLRGSIAFQILTGLLSIYAIWWLVKTLGMELLSSLLGQFVSVGVIVLLIIFQPEVRRFLLMLGNNTLLRRFRAIQSWLGWEDKELVAGKEVLFEELYESILHFSKTKTGALVVTGSDPNMQTYGSHGISIGAKVSKVLLLSIFQRESPLHDGAVLISRSRIQAASLVLPVSTNPNLPAAMGLRHRSALGISEATDAAAFVVSEETGQISCAFQGKLQQNLRPEVLRTLLLRHFKAQAGFEDREVVPV